jgi:DNA-binding transcriptional LysR family regulator
MNFLPMSYFICVAKNGGISPAAKELHITQQTLSAHMAALEKELGCQLFSRRPRFELTYAGKRFLEYARNFCDSYETMQNEFQDIQNTESGVVHVGVAHTRSRTIMPGIISEFQKLYPNIQIISNEQTNSKIIDALLAGKRDVAIARCDISMPELSARALYSENVMLVVSKNLLKASTWKQIKKGKTPLSHDALSQLASVPFFMSSEEDITGRIGSAFLRQNKLNPPIKAYSDNAATLLALCEEGLGACFCPDKLLYAALSPEELNALHVIPIQESYQIHIAHLKSAHQTHAARLFEDFCINYFAKQV